jgi:hypothetical protein
MHLFRCLGNAGFVARVQLHQQQAVGAVPPLKLPQLRRCRGCAAGGHHSVVWPLQQLANKLQPDAPAATLHQGNAAAAGR